MLRERKTLIIGEVYVDVHLDTSGLTRMGGIFHSVRTMNAIQKSFAIAAITPNYLYKEVERYAYNFGAEQSIIIGTIDRCPNVMLIKDSTEAGDQEYNDILHTQAISNLNVEKLIKLMENYNPTDILIYPGKYSLIEILDVIKKYNCRIHIDLQYDSVEIIDSLKNIKIETIIISTSSELFKSKSSGNPSNLVKLLNGKTNGLLLKENRGGSRYFSYLNFNWVEAPTFLSRTLHSVGVGDAYNSVFVSSDETINKTMRLASYIASWYASTFDYESFVSNVHVLHNIKDQIDTLRGIKLNWEDRRNKHIYIAGPDFPHINTEPIEEVYKCLKYHNFSPHRPVLENGLVTGKEDEGEQLKIYEKDLQLLNKCSLLIAVLINDDPGTYVEIGWMNKAGKPTILFDPFKKAENLFLKKTVNVICYSLSEVIDSVFQYLGQEEVEG